MGNERDTGWNIAYGIAVNDIEKTYFGEGSEFIYNIQGCQHVLEPVLEIANDAAPFTCSKYWDLDHLH